MSWGQVGLKSSLSPRQYEISVLWDLLTAITEPLGTQTLPSSNIYQ